MWTHGRTHMHTRTHTNTHTHMHTHTRTHTRTSIDTIDIGRVCLIIRTQRSASRLSKYSINTFYLNNRKLLLNLNLWLQSSYFVYVLNIEPHARVVYCELWCQMVFFVRASAFVRSLHVAASLWSWLICGVLKAH